MIIKAVLVAASLSLVLSSATRAADEPSLDDLLKIPTKPAPKDDTAKPDDHKLPIDPKIAGERELEGDALMQAFKGAVKDMDTVAARLNQDQDPGLDTQRMQESILLRLDKIIAAAKKQQQGGGGSSNQQGKPQQQQSGNQHNAGQQSQTQANAQQSSNPSQGQSGNGQVAPHQKGGDIDELRSEWGHLPPRLRDELIQGRDDKFSATYKALTQEYYRRLAEEGR